MSCIERKVNSKNIYNGKIIDVTLDEIIIEDGSQEGKKSYREVVYHRGGVCALVKLKNGLIPLVRQYRYAVGMDMLELPAGKLEVDELPDEAIVRELEEEVGIIPNKIVSLGKIYVSPGFTNEMLHLYYVDDYTEGNVHFDEDEFIDKELYTYDELIKLIEEEKIIDGKTVTAAYKCQRYFKEN